MVLYKKGFFGGGMGMSSPRKMISFLLGFVCIIFGGIPLLFQMKVIGFTLPVLPNLLLWILGLAGGLKEIEPMVGIQRPSHLRGSATDAWKAFWASGDHEYLELLIAYNEQDAVSLYQLMEWCTARLNV